MIVRVPFGVEHWPSTFIDCHYHCHRDHDPCLDHTKITSENLQKTPSQGELYNQDRGKIVQSHVRKASEDLRKDAKVFRNACGAWRPLWQLKRRHENCFVARRRRFAICTGLSCLLNGLNWPRFLAKTPVGLRQCCGLAYSSAASES